MKNIELYDEVILLSKKAKRLGKTMPYTSSNGYMYSQLNKSGEIGIRLPRERQEELKLNHGFELFKSYGAVMKDYVKIPEKLYNNKPFIAQLLIEGLDHVNGLPTK